MSHFIRQNKKVKICLRLYFELVSPLILIFCKLMIKKKDLLGRMFKMQNILVLLNSCLMRGIMVENV